LVALGRKVVTMKVGIYIFQSHYPTVIILILPSVILYIVVAAITVSARIVYSSGNEINGSSPFGPGFSESFIANTNL